MQHIRGVFISKSSSAMHNLRTNFNWFFNITKPVFKDRLNESEEKWSKICKESFETSPDKDYSAISRSKASVHDIHYLSEMKRSGLSMYTLIADKGYLSSIYQLDLFNFCQENLQTPKRANQESKLYPVICKKVRNELILCLHNYEINVC